MRRYEIRVPSKGKPKIDYSKELNIEQRKVVTEGDGQVLVLAGPGSGKTRTLIYRVAYLLEKGIKPENILLVTFTNKAAREMLTRIENLLKYKPVGLWGGTFHHIGNLCLRRYADRLGYSRSFTILDREDSKDLIDSCIVELNLDTKERRFPKSDVVEAIINFSTNSQEPIDSTIRSKYSYFEEIIPEIERVSKLYAQRKKDSNLMDYDDLLTKWIWLLENFGDARDHYTKQFQYILVDEYQDTNRLQFKIVQLLSEHHKNILVVGDDAQSIYSFRAADIRNILDFPKQFPETKIFKLETNYRSIPQILNMANETIKHNLNQFPKNLRSVKGEGELPALVRLKDMDRQSEFIAQRILELREEGIPMNEIAILFRARYQAASLELELTKRDIPYIVRGGVRFFEQAHIKDVLAHLRIIVNPKDELSWKRALKLQPGIGRIYSERIWNGISSSSNPVDLALSPHISIELPDRAKSGWKRFLKLLRRITPAERSPSKTIQQILKGGYDDYLKLTFENAHDRLEDINQLSVIARDYKSAGRFLSKLISREGFKGETILGWEEEDEYVVLSTIHQAKGLEWEVVMLMGLCDGQFPHPKALNDELLFEEERRLFYVGITRAKRGLYLTHPILRRDYRFGEIITKPSQFIEELSPGCYEEWEIEEGVVPEVGVEPT